MVDKVVDMAVIHKITQLTDAVGTLQIEVSRLQDAFTRMIINEKKLQRRIDRQETMILRQGMPLE